jgi:hypothetical protein
MDEEKAPQRDPQAKTETAPTQPAPTPPDAPGPSKDPRWASAPTSQVVRTVATALLTVVVVLVALFLLWKVRMESQDLQRMS